MAFVEGSTFKGVMIPRFDSKPNGPQVQSFTRCVCGGLWANHRLVDGACPQKVIDNPPTTG